MAYGTTHTATLPTVGSTAGTTYATQINAAIEELRTTLNAKVTPGGMDISSDLSFRSGATYSGITDAHRVSLYQQSAAINANTYPSAVYSVSGDLYFNDASGNQIRLTSGGAINASSTGAITGAGYGSPVEVNWSAGSTLYHFYADSSASPTTYADIRVLGLQLNDASSNYIELAAPSLAADYTLTLPNAVPAANNSVVQVSTTGAMSWTASPTITALTTTGAVAVGSTLAVTGTSALSDTLTMATNKNIVLQSDGKLVHGTRFLVVAGAQFNGGTVEDDGTVTGSSGQPCVYSIPLPAGTLISNVAWEAVHGPNSGSREYRLRRIPATGGAPVTVETDSSSVESGAVSINTTTDVNTMSSGSAYILVWDPATSDNLISVTISYSTPA